MSVPQVQSSSPKRPFDASKSDQDTAQKSPKVHRPESFSPDRSFAMREVQTVAAPLLSLPSQSAQMQVQPPTAFTTPEFKPSNPPLSDTRDFTLEKESPLAFKQSAHSHAPLSLSPLATPEKPLVSAEQSAFNPLAVYQPSKAPPPSPRKTKTPTLAYKGSLSALSMTPPGQGMGRVQSAALAMHSHSHSHSASMSMPFASHSQVAGPVHTGFSAKPVKVKPDGDVPSLRNKGPFKPVKLLDEDDTQSKPLRNSPPPPSPMPRVATKPDDFNSEFAPIERQEGGLSEAAHSKILAKLKAAGEQANPYAKTSEGAGKKSSVKLQGEDIPLQAVENTWGTYSQLFLEVDDETSLVKVLHSKHYHKGPKYCDSLYDTIIAQHDALRARGIKVVQITNRATAKQDGCLRMRYIEEAFIPGDLFKGAISEKGDALLDQYINFLAVALEGTPNTQIDMDPSNFRVDALDGKLILVDFREAPISPQNLVLNLLQNIKTLFQGNLEVTGRIRDRITKIDTPIAKALLANPAFIEICPMEDL